MNDPLETIRRAYRYVVAYERRILDAVDVVDEALRKYDFEQHTPYRWLPIYNSFPSRKFAPESWAWDNFPNYAMRYRWISGEPNALGSRWVLLDHIADTAYERRRHDHRDEPDPLVDLGDPAESTSVVRWHLVTFTEPLPKRTYDLSWNDLLATSLGRPASDFLPSVATRSSLKFDSEMISLRTHCIEVSELSDSEALNKQLLVPLLKAIDATA